MDEAHPEPLLLTSFLEGISNCTHFLEGFAMAPCNQACERNTNALANCHSHGSEIRIIAIMGSRPASTILYATTKVTEQSKVIPCAVFFLLI